jgi:DNA-binding response OmpR family regulator
MEAKISHILLVEDEAKLARFIELELMYEGYSVDVVNDGCEALEMFKQKSYDLVLLDLMLPGLNGIEVLRKIRESSDVSVIMLTAKADVSDKVTGLDSGADDYITKPFAIEELLARMRTTLRVKPLKNQASPLLKCNKLSIDIHKRMVKWEDAAVVDLTKTEFELWTYLVQNKNAVLTRKQILCAVWGFDYDGSTNVVDVYIRYLRSKIDDKFDEKLIHTARGVGYYVKDEK